MERSGRGGGGDGGRSVIIRPAIHTDFICCIIIYTFFVLVMCMYTDFVSYFSFITIFTYSLCLSVFSSLKKKFFFAVCWIFLESFCFYCWITVYASWLAGFIHSSPHSLTHSIKFVILFQCTP